MSVQDHMADYNIYCFLSLTLNDLRSKIRVYKESEKGRLPKEHYLYEQRSKLWSALRKISKTGQRVTITQSVYSTIVSTHFDLPEGNIEECSLACTKSQASDFK